MTRRPTATYRLQFGPAFTLRDAEAVVPYLDDLGVSHVYAAPIFAARAGSEHGYDVVDPCRINPELGTRDDLARIAADLRRRGLGWLQDFVPNHMAYHPANPYLVDVLENGPASRHAAWFDITWEHAHERFRGRVLAPFLGRHYVECLEDGELRLGLDNAGLHVTTFGWRCPLRPESYPAVLGRDLDRLRDEVAADDPFLLRFLGIVHTFENVPPGGDPGRDEQIAFAKHLLQEVYAQEPRARTFIDHNIARLNGTPGDPRSFDDLDAILAAQHYRLAYWQVAAEEISYRRFFTVNDLISLRVEDPQVFAEVHALLRELIADDLIQGVRVDHVDGLADPGGYLRRLRDLAPDAWIVVEKILDFQEELPRAWPVAGATGYEFLNLVTGLFVRRENLAAIDRVYRRHLGRALSFPALVLQAKRLMVAEHLAGDVENLAHLLLGISGTMRAGHDFTHVGLRAALAEVLAAFPVYRTYLPGDDRPAEDATYIRRALDQAARALPRLAREVAFIGGILVGEGSAPPDLPERSRLFTARFQQLTGPLMAKGFEDTALYRYNRLLALNEVGSDPLRFGVSDIEMHHQLRKRAADWPHALNTTSTHDTKRGEDVRARLCVLSEIPDAWGRALASWHKLNDPHRRRVGRHRAPTRNDEVLLYQTLLGSWPAEGATDHYRARIRDYLIKALREAKAHSTWHDPDEDYEGAVIAFADAILADGSPFLAEFLPLQKVVARHGAWNGLSQLLVKLTAPGIPDTYQGTETWDLSLVDPDNRRPVDWTHRRDQLADLQRRAEEDLPSLIADLLANADDGRVKHFLLWRLLHLRRTEGDLFRHGEYVLVEKSGKRRDHVIAFARHHEGRWCLTVAPRFLTGVVGVDQLPIGSDVWDDTTVQVVTDKALPRTWRDAVTGEMIDSGSVPVATALRRFPGCALIGEAG